MIFLMFIIVIIAAISLWFMWKFKSKMNYPKQIESKNSMMIFYTSLFAVSPSDIEENTENVIKEFVDQIDELCETKKNNLRYIDVFQGIDVLQSLSGAATWHSVCSALEMVSPNEHVRTAAHSALEKMGNVFIDKLSNNKALYALCKKYVEQGVDKETLSPEQQFFIDHTMKQFKRAGLDTDDSTFARIAELKKELVVLGLQFDAAIAQDHTVVMASLEELDGVRKEFIEQLSKDENGLYQLRLDYPTHAELMSKCTNAQLRQKYYTVFNNRAYPINEATLQKIIQKRNELAQLLGYQTFADFDLADQMVGSVKNAQHFLNDLVERCKPKVVQEFADLKKIEHPSVIWTSENKLQPWDLDFVSTQYKNKFYDIDPNTIAQYFPVEKTINALLAIYSDFLGITFKQVEYQGFWHDSVRIVHVFAADKTLLGTLLLDLYPRPGKYTHACQMTIIPSFIEDTNKQYPGLAVVLANFPAPSADKPALLKLGDVRTFFHEFGHALHALLGSTRVVSLSGTNTKTDFVELPSQLLEEWLWDKQILKRVSSHYQTGQPFSDDLVDRIVQLKNFSTGYFVQRQAYLAKLALYYYNSPESVDLGKGMQELYQSIITHVVYPKDTHFYASFGHLYGYGAKYYGYLWSNVFAQDLFDTIKKQGLTDQTVGKKYITSILKPGGTQDPTDMLVAFLGRKPNSDAFFRAMGI